MDQAPATHPPREELDGTRWFDVVGAAALAVLAVVESMTLLLLDNMSSLNLISGAAAAGLGLIALLTYCMAQRFRKGVHFALSRWQKFVGGWFVAPLIVLGLLAVNLLLQALLYDSHRGALHLSHAGPTSGALLFIAYIRGGSGRWALVVLVMASKLAAPHLVAADLFGADTARVGVTAAAIAASMALLLAESVAWLQVRRRQITRVHSL